MGFNCGIVGLPNVGKSTLFNALTATAAAQAANFPFCTIEPNVGRVAIPDKRLDELASIAGSAKIIPAQLEFVDIAGLVEGASKGEGLGNQFLSHIREVDAIAVTQGPGLLGSLLVGLSFAKGLALIRQIPIIGVNHIDAHMYANFIDHPESYPFVCLTVSGGHTRLVHVTDPFHHILLGTTRDDAAGEAFDKIGKLLGLPYPGGPEIDKLAREGDPRFHDFPKAMLNQGFEFSFSGLKTNVLYYLKEKDQDFIDNHLADICASVSEAITHVLVTKLKRAVKKTGVNVVMLAGGVSANSMLRSKSMAIAEKLGVELLIPRMEYCTDNAAMIAITGHMKAQRSEFDGMSLKPFTRME